MRFLRSPLGVLVALIGLAAMTVLGAAALQVHRATTPPRATVEVLDFDSVLLRVEAARFSSVDEVPLQGWLMRGLAGYPPILLCHDLGASKGSLINLGIALHDAGFTVLLFDFRGHGDSEGVRSTLGLNEKRGVLGAMDYLSRLEGLQPRQFGIYGTGMGAHAAVLAAADRPGLGVLVLDGLYPDVGYPLMRNSRMPWGRAGARLSFLPRSIFSVMSGTSVERHRAADILPTLAGREMLLLAPAGDAVLAAEMQAMYETIPHQKDLEGNLVLLPATLGDGLYGDDLERYQRRVVEFFETRLLPEETDLLTRN